LPKPSFFTQKLNNSLAENIVGQWDLNGDTKDLSGNGNDGAIAGTVTWDTDKINCVSGGCATFSVGRIQIPGLTSLPGNMTFSGWFKKTTSNWVLSIAFLGKNETVQRDGCFTETAGTRPDISAGIRII